MKHVLESLNKLITVKPPLTLSNMGHLTTEEPKSNLTIWEFPHAIEPVTKQVECTVCLTMDFKANIAIFAEFSKLFNPKRRFVNVFLTTSCFLGAMHFFKFSA